MATVILAQWRADRILMEHESQVLGTFRFQWPVWSRAAGGTNVVTSPGVGTIWRRRPARGRSVGQRSSG